MPSSTRSRVAPRPPGKRRDHDLLVIADRRAAIEAAFERARPGDIVLLAGKGHEQVDHRARRPATVERARGSWRPRCTGRGFG